MAAPNTQGIMENVYHDGTVSGSIPGSVYIIEIGKEVSGPSRILLVDKNTGKEYSHLSFYSKGAQSLDEKEIENLLYLTDQGAIIKISLEKMIQKGGLRLTA